MFTKQTIRDIDVTNKKILLRADYNVPVEDGRITDDYRIQKSLPTVKYLLDHGAALIICSHLGRPEGVDKKFSLKPVAEPLSHMLKEPVEFAADCVGPEATQVATGLSPGQVLLLENLRFHAEEQADDDGFAKQLADLTGPDGIFVQDGFGVVHRAHASTVAVTKHLPAVAGFLLETEVDTITEAMEHPAKPLLALVGGAKIADKIDVLKRFIDIADTIAIGGAMANTFLAAQGIAVGQSLYDKDQLDQANQIVSAAGKKGTDFIIPSDGVVAHEMKASAKTRVVRFQSDSLKSNDNILDIGPDSAKKIADLVKAAKSVIWNGTMGVTEIKEFAAGTDTVIKALTTDPKPRTLVGGGDTAGYLENRHIVDKFAFVSTGGGASLDLMSGRPLPGVEALRSK